MCGLAGAFTQDSKKELSEKQRYRRARVLEGLLYANASRGTDATGLATICDDERCVYKRAVPSYQFVEDKAARGHMRTSMPLVLGHTRYGTTGKNTDDNAHPFEEGNVIGTHNGVISNYTSIDAYIRQALEIDAKDYNWAAVDSQTVFRLFNHVGPAKYRDAIEKVRGSAALVWHDQRNPSALWMVRHGNPLNLAWVPSMGTLFWSSQYDHLSSVLWSVFGKEWLSVTIKEDVLYMFPRADVLDIEKWPVKFDEPATTYSSYRGGGYAGYSHGGSWYDEFGSQSVAWWEDEDDDGDVQHPYAVAKVTRKAEGKGKGDSTSTSSVGAAAASTTSDSLPTVTDATNHLGLENVIEVLNRMGIPVEDAAVVSDSPRSTTDTGEPEEDVPAPFDDPNCTVCQQPLEQVEMGRYFRNTGEWICAGCLTFWENEEPGMLEAMGHAYH